MARNIFSLIAFAIFLFLFLFGIRKNIMLTDKYEWLPTECADYNYPMQIIDGKFISKNTSYIYIPDKKIISNGWGNIGSIHIIGDNLKPIPDKLVISWFSFAEDKFYSGTFDLPYEKIKFLFEKGYTDPVDGKKTTYNMIMVGLAPEGEISVWLSGAIVTEISNFQAKETNIEWEQLIANPNISRKDYITAILTDEIGESKQAYLEKRNIPHSSWKTPQEIAKIGIPHGLWKMYREKYLWEPEIMGNSKPIRMWITTFNGEKNYIDFPSHKSKKEIAIVPKQINIEWKTTSGNEYMANIFFNEQEIFRAFKKFNEYNPNEILKLQLEISDTLHSINVSLKSSDFILKLDASKAMVYSVE